MNNGKQVLHETQRNHEAWWPWIWNFLSESPSIFSVSPQNWITFKLLYVEIRYFMNSRTWLIACEYWESCKNYRNKFLWRSKEHRSRSGFFKNKDWNISLHLERIVAWNLILRCIHSGAKSDTLMDCSTKGKKGEEGTVLYMLLSSFHL